MAARNGEMKAIVPVQSVLSDALCSSATSVAKFCNISAGPLVLVVMSSQLPSKRHDFSVPAFYLY